MTRVTSNLTVGQVAELASVSKRQVWRWIDDGALAVIGRELVNGRKHSVLGRAAVRKFLKERAR